MVDFASRQGRPREIRFAFHRAGTRVFAAGVAALRRGGLFTSRRRKPAENAASGAKDAIYGWTLATISWFCREFERLYSGLRIEKKIDIEERDVPEPLKIVVFRIMQEALNNVGKYADADLVRLSIHKTGSKIELVIEDNGQGFNVEPLHSVDKAMEGVGLSSMKQRTQLSGGSFSIDSIKGAGTTVRASWPGGVPQ